MASITYSKVLEWIAWMIVNLFLEISGHLYARAQGKASIPQKPRTNFKRWNWKGRQSRRWIDGFLRSICWFFVLFWNVLVGKVYQCQWCFSFLVPSRHKGPNSESTKSEGVWVDGKHQEISWHGEVCVDVPELVRSHTIFDECGAFQRSYLWRSTVANWGVVTKLRSIEGSGTFCCQNFHLDKHCVFFHMMRT